MTLFNIARKNIKKDFKNYFLYFASMTFSIIIYFTFISLKYTDTIVESAASSTNVQSVFNGASVVLMVFVAIFIWYSNAFFTRRRKKEIGLYSLLGVRKKQIGRMLFYENFLMGLLSLVVGVLIGSGLSKFFVSILMKVMGYEAIANFAISIEAIINTFIVFIMIIAITSLHGYRLIYRFKLIELFQADKEKEEDPKASVFLALLSLVLVGFGYYLALEDIVESELWQKIGLLATPLVILILIIIGSYLLFSTLSVYFLRLARKNKRSFWKGTNLISVSQLLYRMKGNARTLTIIAVLSATTLTAVGGSYSFYYNTKENAEVANPNSMMFISNDEEKNKEIHEEIVLADAHDIIYHESVPSFKVEVDTTQLNNHIGQARAYYSIISNESFNELAELQGQEDRMSLKENEAAILDAGYYEGLSPEYVDQSIPLEVGELQEEITFKELKKYSVLNMKTAGITAVVSDELFAELAKETETLNLEIYEVKNQQDAEALDKKLSGLLPEEALYASFYEVYAAGMESNGLFIFIGVFLGLVFIAATGSIIYFKQLSEASADKERYQVLHKIGLNKKEIRRSISKQVFVVFALPLVVGIVHSSVALTALSGLLQTNLLVPILICIGIYTLIYVAYYFLTVHTYYKIVTE